MTFGRALDSELIAPRVSHGLAVVALIAVNLVPVVGVLFLDWSVGTLVFLYWFENAVVGAWNAAKLLLAAGADSDGDAVPLRVRDENVPDVLFFLVHYGGFWLGHGVFVALWFVVPDPSVPGAIDGWHAVAFAGLVCSHGISFLQNFVQGGEYRTVTTDELFLQPYRRVIALHVAILVGAQVVDSAGAPIGGLLLLVLFKTVFDLYEHLREHRRLGDHT